MPGPEDPLRSDLERLATPADPAGAYERIVEKKIRRQIYRKLQVAALAVVVLAGTVGGTFVLASVFRADRQRQSPLGALAANGMIAFVSNRDGNPEVFVMERDGTHVVNLTRNPADDHSPAFSPDGTKIAFVSNRSGGPDIYVMNANGTDVRRLTTFPGQDESPSWSPDGTKIAFADNTDIGGHITNYKLYVMNADGSSVTRLTEGEALIPDSRPAWSPDGNRIAVASEEPIFPATCPPTSICHPLGHRHVIVVARADGSVLDRLPGTPDQASAPAWSPDGRRIAFESDGHLFVMAADGNGVRQVTMGPAVDGAPAWSPDGTKLVFSSDLQGNRSVEVVDITGAGRKRLTSGVADQSAPSWQPVPKGPTPVEPSESPTESPSPSPEPSESPSPLPAGCNSSATGDFDGDGRPDRAAVCRLGDGTYSLSVEWGGGASGGVDLPDCQVDVCRATAAADLDGDGADEFILQVGEGASTSFFEVYELPASENFGHSPATTAAPGAPGFEAGKPTVFGMEGSVTHQDFFTCETGEGGTPQVIATSAVLNKAQTEWTIHETTFTFDPSLNWPNGQFVVVSTADSTLAFDPTGQIEPQPRGSPCWTGGASPSPTSVP